jgi:ADP-heptose:LPS heptosyltransferase
MAVAVALRPLGLGDLLTAIPALRGLRRAYPRHRIVLAAPAPLAPLALHTGAVDAVVPAGPLERLGPAVDGADVAANLHGRGPESHRILLERRPRRLIAFAHDEVDQSTSGPRWNEEEHEVERWCRLLCESGIDADADDLTISPPYGVQPDHDLTLIHPGAAGPARRWPAERWAAVAAAEYGRGRRVVLTGSASERPLCRWVAAAAGLRPAAVMAGATGVMELVWLVASAGRVASADTGVAHLATALARPSLVLFGPTSPHLHGPPGGEARHRVLWHDGRDLLAITADEVADALDDLTERGAARISSATTIRAGRRGRRRGP